MRGLPDCTRKREAKLIAVGAWVPTDEGGIRLTGYLEVKRAKAEIGRGA